MYGMYAYGMTVLPLIVVLAPHLSAPTSPLPRASGPVPIVGGHLTNGGRTTYFGSKPLPTLWTTPPHDHPL